jgi:hypothetical protein
MTVLTITIILIMNKKFPIKVRMYKNASLQKPDISRINFSDRWFQVFDYLSKNHDMYVPTNTQKFLRFINDLEINQPEIFKKLCCHLEEFSAENILNHLRELKIKN